MSLDPTGFLRRYSQLLFFPFNLPELVKFNLDYKNFPDVPFLRLFYLLLSNIPKGKLKATITGNLPRNLCREAARLYLGEEQYQNLTKWFNIYTERDFNEIHTVRLVSEMAGFIRKQKGWFYLTKRGERVLKKGLDGKDFMRLFQTFTLRFNWGYPDRYPELGIVQRSFLFTLFILQRYGDIYRDPSFYSDIFIKTFPEAHQEVEESPYWKVDEEVSRCYQIRALERFVYFLGFADFKIIERTGFVLLQYKVKRTRFLDEWIHFCLE